MNKLYSSLLISFTSLFTTMSVSADESTQQTSANIELSTQNIQETGGYLSADIFINNKSNDFENIKYWLSVKGPKGLSFPAKSVVQGDNSNIETVETGSILSFSRGIWIRDYMEDGLYTVSIEGVNTDTGVIFKESSQFVKGVDLLNPAVIDGLSLQVSLSIASSIPSDGGYLPLYIDVQNAREIPASVEFWITAEGPDGLNIPINSRQALTIGGEDSYTKARGFRFDASYPKGEYVLTTQMYDVASGQHIEYSLSVFKD
ncbi:RbmA protein [Vibrionales bacterium C3R12]|nr:RbmA protein [Vibrionales bacterium C3R12]